MVAISRSSAVRSCHCCSGSGIGSYVKHGGIFLAGVAFGFLLSNITTPFLLPSWPTLVHNVVENHENNNGNNNDNINYSLDFYSIGLRAGTDKVIGEVGLPKCLKDSRKCYWPGAVNPKCLIFGHFYHTLYNTWLRTPEYTSNDTEPFQALEIGFSHGSGYQTFSEFLSPQAIIHSIEIQCLPRGPRSEGKWPGTNRAEKSPRYSELLEKKLLHCGDAADYDHLYHVWTDEIETRQHPLKLVIDDASHVADHMAISLFFWFPRLAPGGLLIMEDIEPTVVANPFRAHVLPQVIFDMHYCGKKTHKDGFREHACFPTIQPLLQSVHCELHICVFQRNMEPAMDLSKEDSMPPKHTFNAQECLFQDHTKSW